MEPAFFVLCGLPFCVKSRQESTDFRETSQTDGQKGGKMIVGF